MLKQAGFTVLPKRGKGSHSYWIHPLLPKPVVLSGKDAGDAKPYQERQVNTALRKVEQTEQGEEE